MSDTAGQPTSSRAVPLGDAANGHCNTWTGSRSDSITRRLRSHPQAARIHVAPGLMKHQSGHQTTRKRSSCRTQTVTAGYSRGLIRIPANSCALFR